MEDPVYAAAADIFCGSSSVAAARWVVSPVSAVDARDGLAITLSSPGGEDAPTVLTPVPGSSPPGMPDVPRWPAFE